MAPTKRTTSPAFQFYPKDFMSSSKVLRMSNTEVGIYMKLLCVCWLDNGLPTDPAALARITGTAVRPFTRLWNGALHECFCERAGKLYNERLDRERKAQADFRQKQKAKAEKRWQSRGNAGDMPERHSHGNALQSPLASPSPSAERTHTQGGAPIHQTHRSHAACGRVCVPADLHSMFVRARNHPNADKELRDWYLAVDDEWSVGSRKDDNPGGNDYRFWRARFEERWPATVAVKPDPRLPKWAQKVKAGQ